MHRSRNPQIFQLSKGFRFRDQFSPIIPPLMSWNSVSHLMKEHYGLAMKFKDILATYKSAEDLINIGAYTRGSNPKIDQAIQKYELMIPYLKQGIVESVDWRTSMNELKKILEDES